MIPDEEFADLLKAAWRARDQAYAPYTNFLVGAALLSETGDIFCGSNVENLSLGLTMCAERVAMASAIQSGQRKFRAIAVVGGQEPIVPCGACRQVLAEFAAELQVVSEGLEGGRQLWELSALLPFRSTGILDR